MMIEGHRSSLISWSTRRTKKLYHQPTVVPAATVRVNELKPPEGTLGIGSVGCASSNGHGVVWPCELPFSLRVNGPCKETKVTLCPRWTCRAKGTYQRSNLPRAFPT